jgi:uncharacterized protein
MAERVHTIDALRGVALFGILVMNIQAFAMPHAAYLNPSAYGSLEGINGFAWVISRLCFDFKFISIFSMLFGASMALAGRPGSTDGTNNKPASRAPRIRLLWLIGFGLLHGYLVWYGDILFTYGVVGLCVYPALSWTPTRQVRVGAVLLALSSLIAFGAWAFYEHLPAFFLDDIHSHFDRSDVLAELNAYRSGWRTQLFFRAHLTFTNQVTGTVLEAGWRAAGCMLIGMAAVRTKAFEGRFGAWPWLPLTLGLGGGLTTAGILLQQNSRHVLRPWFLAQAVHQLGAIGLALGIALAVVLVASKHAHSFLVQAVARLGRVALSAYLMQSIIGTFIFGGHGLGFFGKADRITLLLAPCIFWLLQLGLAYVWTSHYKAGPFEWLWRRLVQFGQKPTRPRAP